MNTESYVGLTLEQARIKAEKEKITVRVAQIDDKVFIGTCDFVIDRINLVIKDGLIIEANIG